MTEAKLRLYKFLVEMNRITKEEYEKITGLNWLEEQENPEVAEENKRLIGEEIE